MKADSVFAILSAKIKKVDGSQAQHYSELAEEAARNAAADAAHIQESSAAIDALEETVGDENSGLVKDVADLETTVGDAESGLVKDVNDLKTTVGDANSGLVKDVSDAQDDITELQTNEIDPKYYEASDRLSLREKTETPTYSFNSTSFIDCTRKDNPVCQNRVPNYNYTNNVNINNPNANSLYFACSLYYGSNWQAWKALVEYNADSNFMLSNSSVVVQRDGSSRTEDKSPTITDIGKYRVMIFNAGRLYGDGILYDSYPNGRTYSNLGNISGEEIISLLNLQIGEVIDPMSSLRIDDKLYEVVDQAARDQVAVNTTNIQTLSTAVGDANSGLVKEVDDLGTQVALNVTNIQTLSNAVDAITPIETSVSGTDPVIMANKNTRYICGEVATVSFTPSQTGICELIFTSGSTATVLTLPSTVNMPEWFVVEANRTYEISILNGVYGGVMSWPV